jgi:hypothetical protein
MAVVMLATVVVGFANSETHRVGTGGPPLALYVVAHAVLFASWFVIFLVQTTLVATGRLAVHRRLGYVAAAAAAIMTVTGPWLAVSAARRGTLPGDGLAFMLVMIVDVVGFAIFVGLAIYYRKSSETHKRFMLLGTISMLGPAVSRWPFVTTHGALVIPVFLGFLLAAPGRDLLAHRRVHPVSLWGGLALFASGPLRFAIAQSAAWHHFARRLIGLGL